LLRLLSDVTVLDLDAEIARRFGVIRAGLLDRGRPVPATDLLIAATALVHDLTLVTHNVQHFAEVPGLRLADWLTS
jgi:tRNA(fMet)-specific endonuclease VapC